MCVVLCFGLNAILDKCLGNARRKFPQQHKRWGVLDHRSVVHWLRLGRTRVHVGAPVVVPPQELPVKSHFCGPKREARPDFESSRCADSTSGLLFPQCETLHVRCQCKFSHAFPMTTSVAEFLKMIKKDSKLTGAGVCMRCRRSAGRICLLPGGTAHVYAAAAAKGCGVAHGVRKQKGWRSGGVVWCLGNARR
jgi:hypothetical protein